MCIRDSLGWEKTGRQRIDPDAVFCPLRRQCLGEIDQATLCLLYTSDAADERSSVDLGGRRIIKKKKAVNSQTSIQTHTKKLDSEVHNIYQAQENTSTKEQ